MKNRRSLLVLTAVTVIAVLLSHPASADWNKHLQPSTLPTRQFETGKAEVALYRAKEIALRRSRPARLLIITENAAAGRVHLQIMREFPVGVSPYRQDTYLTLDGASARAERLSFSEQTLGSGLTRTLDFARKQLQWVSSGREAAQNGSGTLVLDGDAQITAYEALPFLVRGLPLDKPLEFTFNMWEPLANPIGSAKGDTLRSGPAQLSVGAETNLDIVGKTYKVVPVTIRHYLGEERFWVARDASRLLVQWWRYNGSEYSLREVRRLDYWNLTQDTEAGLLD